MTELVAVRIDRKMKAQIKKDGIKVSETVRRALLEEIRRREEKELAESLGTEGRARQGGRRGHSPGDKEGEGREASSLLDASSLVLMMKRSGERMVPMLRNFWTPDLASTRSATQYWRKINCRRSFPPRKPQEPRATGVIPRIL